MNRGASATSVMRGGRRTASPDLSEADLRQAFNALEGVPGAGPARQKIAEALAEARGREREESNRLRERVAREARVECELFRFAELVTTGVPGPRRWVRGRFGDVLLPV